MGCTVRAAPRLMQSSLFQGRTSISYRFTFNCDLNQNTPLITTKPINMPEKDAHLSISFLHAKTNIQGCLFHIINMVNVELVFTVLLGLYDQ